MPGGRRGGYLRIATLVAFALLCVFPLASMSSCCRGEAQLDASTIQDLERMVDGFMGENGVPGAMVGVWIPGRGNRTAARGEADTATAEAMRDTHLMRIGSATKPYTATVVLQPADEGKLSLDQKLAHFYPDISYADTITMRQLLNHTSGIVDEYPDACFREKSLDPLRRWTPPELIAVSAGAGDPAFSPGEGFHYSNTNYYLLVLPPGRRRGEGDRERPDGGAARPHLRAPRTRQHLLPRRPGIAGEHPRSHVEVEGELLDISGSINPSITWAAGAVFSDLYDLKAWVRALATGELLSEETQSAMLQWVDIHPPQATFLMGPGIPWDHGFLGHNGEFSGYQTSAFYLPGAGATIIVLVNRAGTFQRLYMFLQSEGATIIVLVNRVGTAEAVDTLSREPAQYLFPEERAGARLLP